ncbi:MAG: serine/threonine-protein kinase [Thermodesulfobacteriota bacterium]
MSDLYSNRWKVIRSLGEGGQAHTFLVEDTISAGSGQFVLKRLKNIDRLDRFEREIEAVRKLAHPNILPLIDQDLSGSRPYFVSPYAEHGSLAERPTAWKGNPEAALALLIDIAEGLAHAHSNGIVHRDIKPANILLSGAPKRPVIADFGICYVADGDRITLTDEAVGPRLFVAPELEDGRVDQVSARSDVYSLGKILYWLLNGGKLFARENHRDERWNLVSQFSDPSLEHINRMLDRMITLDPSNRYRDADEVMVAARHILGLFRKHARAIAPGLPQECAFCLQGHYREVRLSSPGAIRNFGFQAIGGAKWHALICDTCGNVQLFRLEDASAKGEFWGR